MISSYITVSARRSDAERMMRQLRLESFETLFSEKQQEKIELDRERSNGCRACFDICPVVVYAGLNGDKTITFRDQHACFACSACARQCPEGALSLIQGDTALRGPYPR